MHLILNSDITIWIGFGSDTIEANDYSDHQCSYIKVSNSDLDFLRGSCQDEAHGILCNDGYTNGKFNSKLITMLDLSFTYFYPESQMLKTFKTGD